MLLQRSIWRELPRIFAREPISLVKASTADARHRSWTRSFEKQIGADDDEHSLRNYRFETRSRSATSSRSRLARFSSVRIRHSKERSAASLATRTGIGLTAAEHYRGVQTQIAVSWNHSQRFIGD